jgi:cytochrome b subunit of formate dehydrogenase
VAFLAGVLGFGVTIVAGVLLYAFAFDGAVWLVGQATGPVGSTTRLIIAFAMIFVFVAISARAGRFARDWIERGRAVQRRRPVR